MKFSIRDLLFVTLVVALSVAWWLDRTRLTTETQLLEMRIKNFEASTEAKQNVNKMEAYLPKARAEMEKTIADQAATTEGPVRGYNLLGPPPSKP